MLRRAYRLRPHATSWSASASASSSSTSFATSSSFSTQHAADDRRLMLPEGVDDRHLLLPEVCGVDDGDAVPTVSDFLTKHWVTTTTTTTTTNGHRRRFRPRGNAATRDTWTRDVLDVVRDAEGGGDRRRRGADTTAFVDPFSSTTTTTTTEPSLERLLRDVVESRSENDDHASANAELVETVNDTANNDIVADTDVFVNLSSDTVKNVASNANDTVNDTEAIVDTSAETVDDVVATPSSPSPPSSKAHAKKNKKKHNVNARLHNRLDRLLSKRRPLKIIYDAYVDVIRSGDVVRVEHCTTFLKLAVERADLGMVAKCFRHLSWTAAQDESRYSAVSPALFRDVCRRASYASDRASLTRNHLPLSAASRLFDDLSNWLAEAPARRDDAERGEWSACRVALSTAALDLPWRAVRVPATRRAWFDARRAGDAVRVAPALVRRAANVDDARVLTDAYDVGHRDVAPEDAADAARELASRPDVDARRRRWPPDLDVPAGLRSVLAERAATDGDAELLRAALDRAAAPPSRESYECAVLALAASYRRDHHALAALRDMEEDGHSPSHAFLRQVGVRVGTTAARADNTYYLLTNGHERGVAVTTASLNVVLAAYLETGECDRAFWLLEQGYDHDHHNGDQATARPNATTLELSLELLSRRDGTEGEIEAANALLAELTGKEVEPEGKLLHWYARILIKGGDVHRARKSAENARKRNPTAVLSPTWEMIEAAETDTNTNTPE